MLMVARCHGTGESCLVVGHGREDGTEDLGELQPFCGRQAHEHELARGFGIIDQP